MDVDKRKLELDQLAACSRAARAAVRQAARNDRRRLARRRAVAVCQQLRADGLSDRRIARRLRVASRTLNHWRSCDQRHALRCRPLGRPCKESSCETRAAALQALHHVGPHVGLPSLRAALPHVPPSELRDLQRDYRRWYRHTHRQRLARLRWHAPGAVWAVDHSQPDATIDGCYPAILAVRDLASGMQLAWLPVPDQTAAVAERVLDILFRRHGPPLVLKSDNGSAFIAGAFSELLDRWRVEPLFSPPATPQYNGGCEAGIGAMKVRTFFLGGNQHHPDHWTSGDLEGALHQANHLHRPAPAAPTAHEVWRDRAAITDQQRRQFVEHVAAARHQREQHRINQTPAPQQAAVIQRQSVRQALEELAILSITWRTISPSINRRMLAKIS